MPRFAISAVGRDQPGIVAAVTGVLADHGGNLADSTMATLQGQFAIVLIVTTPPEVDADTLRADLDPVARAFGLVLGVHACSDDDQAGDVAASAAAAAPAPARALQPWLVTVHGGDRPRIVHEITRALADGGGTIVDLTSRLVGPADAPVYTLTMRAMLPEDAAPAIVEAVRRTAEHLQVHCHLRPDDAELL